MITVRDYVVQTLLATLGSILTGTLVPLLLACMTAAFTGNNSGGNFLDHIVEQKVAGFGGEPYFATPIIAGLVFGWLGSGWFRSQLGRWVWLIPAALLAWNVFTWQPGPTRPYWHDVWVNYFGHDCGSSECLYELFVTAPFYTSIAYTLGHVAGKGRRWHMHGGPRAEGSPN